MLPEALSVFAAATTATHLASIALVARRLSHPPGEPATGTPFITLLRPVCGRDPNDMATLGSSFGLDYPDYEVLFCVADSNDPAVTLLRDIIARHPKISARLLIGDDRITANPKLNNLQKGWSASRAHWIAMADSNLLLPPDYLRRLLDHWQTGTGLVSSPPIGIRPEGLAASIECAFLNGNQGRLQLAADSLGLGFAQGKTMFWRRETLDGAGGLAALSHDLAEDAAATKLVRARGERVTLTRHPFAQPIGKRSLRAVWDRQLRWSRVRRDGFPMLFLLEPLNSPLLPTLACALTFGPLYAAVMLKLWYLAEAALLKKAGWPCGWRDVIAMPLRDAMMLPLWLATFAKRGITWRGNAMHPLEITVTAPAPAE